MAVISLALLFSEKPGISPGVPDRPLGSLPGSSPSSATSWLESGQGGPCALCCVSVSAGVFRDGQLTAAGGRQREGLPGAAASRESELLERRRGWGLPGPVVKQGRQGGARVPGEVATVQTGRLGNGHTRTDVGTEELSTREPVGAQQSSLIHGFDFCRFCHERLRLLNGEFQKQAILKS